MIFSANRVSGSAVRICANENYDVHDCGKVLYECALNDRTVFTTAMLREYAEVEAIREGTMVRSELRSFQEFSVKEAWAGLKEKLKKLWEKIKGIFKKVTAKLAVWFVRSGKAYAKLNRKLLNADVGDCKIPSYRAKNSTNYNKLMTSDRYTEAKGLSFDNAALSGTNNATGDSIKARITSLGTTTFDSSFTYEKFSNMNEFAKDFVFGKEVSNKKFSELSVSVGDLLDTISEGKKPLKDLKKAEKTADKSIKKMIKAIEKAQAADAKDFKNDEANKGQNFDKSPYKNASEACNAYQQFITKLVSAQIAVVKFDIKQARSVISKLAAYTPTNESAIFEMSCWLEAMEEDIAEDVDAEDVNADDVKGSEEVEIVITVDGGDVDVDVDED